jgi:hypothetical protein
MKAKPQVKAMPKKRVVAKKADFDRVLGKLINTKPVLRKQPAR